MKWLYLNARGFSNSPIRLTLKDLIKTHKPPKSWMNIVNFILPLLKCLDLKVFAINSREWLAPNLECICKKSLDPQVTFILDQHVSFTLTIIQININVIYASTYHVIRRRLWMELSISKSPFFIP